MMQRSGNGVVALHPSDMAQSRLRWTNRAQAFLSSIELRPRPKPPPSRADSGQPSSRLDAQQRPAASERRVSVSEVRVPERRGSDVGRWQAAAALEFLSNLSLTSPHALDAHGGGSGSSRGGRGDSAGLRGADLDGGAESTPVAPEAAAFAAVAHGRFKALVEAR